MASVITTPSSDATMIPERQISNTLKTNAVTLKAICKGKQTKDQQTDRHLKHHVLSDLCAHRIEKISKSTLVNNKTKLLQEARAIDGAAAA
jgi:hypothetical protein